MYLLMGLMLTYAQVIVLNEKVYGRYFTPYKYTQMRNVWSRSSKLCRFSTLTIVLVCDGPVI